MLVTSSLEMRQSVPCGDEFNEAVRGHSTEQWRFLSRSQYSLNKRTITQQSGVGAPSAVKFRAMALTDSL
jgi:hypothetical protein